MIEVGQSLDLLCSNLTVETRLIHLSASAEVAVIFFFFFKSLTAGVH